MSDLTESSQFAKIVEYSKKLEKIAEGANTMLAPIMMRDFIIAMDLTSDMLAKAIRNDLRAGGKLKQAEAEAYFDRAPEYLKEKGVKESSEAKKMYVPTDPTVISAIDEKAKTEALTVWLKNKLQEFRMAHDDVKKMAYTSDFSNSPNEGL
jgi:hypothetical protein